MLVSKLPGNMRDRWSRRVLTIRRKQVREPDMKDFIHFINDETIIVSDPIFSKEAIEPYLENKSSHRKGKVSTFITGNKEQHDVCIYCDEHHKLADCEKFMDIDLKERIKFLARKKYCYGCL